MDYNKVIEGNNGNGALKLEFMESEGVDVGIFFMDLLSAVALILYSEHWINRVLSLRDEDFVIVSDNRYRCFKRQSCELGIFLFKLCLDLLLTVTFEL